MPFVAGVDSSTQSTKVEIRRLDTGAVVARSSAPHPAVTPPRSEQDPASWTAAFDEAWATAIAQLRAATASGEVVGISIGGQQHGMVALDADDRPVHAAKLWNDTESAPDAAWLLRQLASGDDDGSRAWVERTGSVPVASFTATKLSWLHRTEPAAWARLARVLLPHDYLTFQLTGRYTTDRGDASGTGYWSPFANEYCWDVLDAIDDSLDWPAMLPTVLGPLEAAGSWRDIAVAAGTGDNMAAALGLGLQPGDAAVSIGTSGAVFAVADEPTADVSGMVAGFADATGRYLPLACTSNAAKVLDAFARLLDVDHAELDELALSVEREDRPVLLPYLDGERTPNRPDARGILAGLRSDVSRAELARAAVDGVACGLVDALDALRAVAPVSGRVALTGGGARSRALGGVIAGLVDVPVVVATVEQAVATGAAVQAAALVGGTDHRAVQQRWGLDTSAAAVVEPVAAGDLRERYAALRDGAPSTS